MFYKIRRRKTRKILIGSVVIGGGSPVRVQAMCNTDTRDVRGTARQILELENTGCEIIRVAVPDMEAASKIGRIRKLIHIPLVADIHFDWRLAIESLKQGAAKIRINPGNIGDKSAVKAVAFACRERGVPIRIGVNAGSLKRLKQVKGKPKWTNAEWARIMVNEALAEVRVLENLDFRDIAVSLKADDINRTVSANRLFSERSDIPLHIGITEAGSFLPGAVKSSAAIGMLLADGIGDTIRCSLTEAPAVQVRCAYEILKAFGLREYGPEIISCPTCGRCRVDIHKIIKELEKKIYGSRALLKKSAGMKIAVMGCVVNGPGEARDADFGIAGGEGRGVWLENGKVRRTTLAGKAVKTIPQNKWVEAIIKKIITA